MSAKPATLPDRIADIAGAAAGLAILVFGAILLGGAWLVAATAFVLLGFFAMALIFAPLWLPVAIALGLVFWIARLAGLV